MLSVQSRNNAAWLISAFFASKIKFRQGLSIKPE